jgi:dTDP-4-dehydrorhamnose reductase
MARLRDYYNMTGVDIKDFDIRDGDEVEKRLFVLKPQITLHCAAFTDVDACEKDAKTAMEINADGAENIARACRKVGAVMLYYSTDYVFDGQKKSPYCEDDLPNPKTKYGQSKYEGEKKIAKNLKQFAIIRTSWLYGVHGKNFVKTMIRLGREQIENKKGGIGFRPLRVVDDQIGCPTSAKELVAQTKLIIDRGLTGLFHGACAGATSWFNFARAIFDNLSLDVDLEPCATEESPRPAPRPKYSALENARLNKLGLNVMTRWDKALKEFLDENRTELMA